MITELYIAINEYAPGRPGPAEVEVDWAVVTACVTGGLLLVAIVAIAILAYRKRRLASERLGLQSQLGRSEAEIRAMQDRFRGVVDADAERQRVLGGISEEVAGLQTQRQRLEAELQAARQQATAAISAEVAQLDAQRSRLAAELQALAAQISSAQAQMAALDEEANARSFGFYKPRYDLASSERYQARLEAIRENQKQMLKDKTAAESRSQWTVNGSVAEGRKQINQTLKLILRAFNGECDAAVARVKYNNINVMETRIQKSYEAINSLVTVQECGLAPAFLQLKLQELYLAHEYQEKLQEEKEEQRRIREQMRDEELAAREIEKARKEAEKEEQRYAAALAKARSEAGAALGAEKAKFDAKVAELEQRLADAQQNSRAVAQAQLTRMGHVYVISNIGSFGEHVYKIGMTRRLVPQDRVDELGDAAVPFEFDVHAMIKAMDAPKLETALHRAFHHRRVNMVNMRKEFFRATLEEIVEVVHKMHGEIEVTRLAEAQHYRKTVAMVAAGELPPLPKGATTPTPPPVAAAM
jgi:predicted nuclease with TOPRIM domain